MMTMIKEHINTLLQIRMSLIGMLCMCFLFAGTTSELQAQPSGYGFYKDISINGSQVQGTHTGFPVLIQFTDTDVRDNADSPNGYDIIFGSTDGSVIYDHQIESYNAATGEYMAWVKLTTLPASGSTLRMWYGNGTVSSDPSVATVWSNQFRSVYHFNNTFNDASPNSHNGVNNGSVNVVGKIGRAQSFDGNNDYIAIDNDTYNSSSNSAVTVSMWIQTSNAGDQILMSYDRNEYWRLEINGNGGGAGELGWDLATNGGQLDFGSAGRVDNGAWTHITAVYDNGSARLYIDGIQDATTTSGSAFGTGNLRFGFIGIGSEADTFDGNKGPNSYFNGLIDEVQVSDAARSADWIRTSFNNQNDPSAFYTIGSQQVISSGPAVDPTPPAEVTAVAVEGGGIAVSFEDVDAPGNVVSYSVKRSAVQGGPYSEIGIVTDDESALYTYTDNTATDGTTYFYVVTSLDAQPVESSNAAEVSATSDATLPILQFTSVQADELVIDYNELLDENSVPLDSDLSVQVNGSARSVSSVQVSGSRVILTLDPEVIAGDNVTVSYTPGVNRIQDAAGNDAASFSGLNVNNDTFNPAIYGPDPCPIANTKEAAWACFSGMNGGTSMTADVGGLTIADVTVPSGAQTTFAPNALQEWASGAYAGDQFNGPQVNPVGSGSNATSFDINIPADIPSNALILALNRLRPDVGNTTYTLEAFDAANAKVSVNDWITGQGTDGGVCSNSVALVYSNGNTTIEFQPSVSGNQACSSSSAPLWFRITDPDVRRIEIRKVTAQPDNIHFGLAVTADFGDAPASYGTRYSGTATPPAFHLLTQSGNSVYFGSGVDADGNGVPGAMANGDDLEANGVEDGDDENATSVLSSFNTAQDEYSTTLVCAAGGFVGGWIDFDQSSTFDAGEYASGVCSAGGSVTLNWTNLSGLVTGQTYARFRIAGSQSGVVNPVGAALDGEVEDYPVTVTEPPVPDLQLEKTVSNSEPIEGETVTFTLTLTNPGVYSATGVKVSNTLPSELTYVSSTASQGIYNASTGVWNVGSLAQGDTTIATLTVDAIVGSGTLGNTINNPASVTGLNEVDPDLSNNSASAGITVVPEASDIGITMIVSNNTPIEGETITYTVNVTNNGPRTATSLSVLDQIPTGLNFISSTTSLGNYNENTGIWNIGTLPVSGSASLTLTMSVQGNTEGSTITNSAALNALDQVDPNTNNNTGSAPVVVSPPGIPGSCTEIPNLTFQNPTLQSGSAGQVGAVYVFQNVISGVDAEVEILTIDNATLVAIDQAATGLNANFQPQIEAVDKTQQSGHIDFDVRFIETATGNPRYLTMRASAVDVDGDNVDTREFAGFQRLTSFTVERTTNLVVSSEGIFTTFESANSDVINGIDPNDTENLAFTTYTNEPSFRIRAGIKDPTDNAGGASGQRQFAFSFDPCIINNFNDPVETNIVDVSVIKSVDENTPAVGDTVTYTITVKNEQGNAVGNVEVTDVLPNGLDFVSASASVGTYNSNNGLWNIGNLSGLQSAVLTIQAEVDNGEEGNQIRNTAVVSNFTGTDGNNSNNSAFADIIVFDPGGGLVCNEPPLFSFYGSTLEQGVPRQVNAVYRFSNVASGVDALVKVLNISNATLDVVDDNSIANSPANFSPLFTALQGGGYIDWQIRFVNAGTTDPVKRNFSMTALDIDGFNAGNGNTIRDYLGFTQNQSNTVEFGTDLNVNTAGDFQLFESGVTTDGNGSFDTDHMAYITYNYTSVLEIRTGSFTTGTYSDDRLVDIDFAQCRNQDFDNPVTTTRNADISVVKTADQLNPLENESVNFTITVSNNGPENATELDINETLPAGLTLVQATPSQGAYNQLTKIWSVGTLNNGASATLELETSVGVGFSQDSLVNRAFVQGLNQFDPTVANDTSEVTLRLGVQLTGTVFEDIRGDGFAEDTNFGDASGDQQALQNVEVHLFKDGGDRVADGADDSYEQTVLTSNLGKYVFQVGEDAVYWVAVDSKTGDLSDGTTWGEQTYGPVGAVCIDGAGSESTRTSAGHCFGGRRGDRSDNISETPVKTDLINAEHIAGVNVAGSGVSNIDFGFSFNVVANTDDGDDDITAQRTVQGSFRQFILNANEITGSNTMRFVPAVATNASGSGGSWWQTSLSGALPAITDPLTVINGTAYELNAPKTVRDENTGVTGSGAAVGIDNLSLNTFARKEFELDLNDSGDDAFLINTSGAFTIRNVAVYNGSVSVRIQNASNGLIEKNMIGARADGSDPAGGNRSDKGIEFTGSSSISTLIQDNYMAYMNGSGVFSSNSSAAVTIFRNELTQNARSGTQADAIEGQGRWSITANLIRNNGNPSSSAENGGSGIELGGAVGTSTSNTIRNNTIRDNAVAGISTLNSVTATLIEKNVINSNGTNFSGAGVKKGAGIKLSNPSGSVQQGIRITRNSFFTNYGLSIDVVQNNGPEADGVNVNNGAVQSASVTPNRELDYPIFTLSTVENDVLNIEGYVGTSTTTLSGSFTIEVYKAENDGDGIAINQTGETITSPHGEGKNYIGTITTNTNGTFSTFITLDGSVPLSVNDRITAIAISSSNNTSEFSGNQRIVPTGVSISGFVYHDLNNNALKDGGEPGLENVTMVLYNRTQNNCKSVYTDSDGRYVFSNVLNGTYDLIESFGQSIPTPDICTPAENDPDGFVSTTPNLRTVTVNNLPAFQDFGDFEGVRITGKVINDSGIASGTANDGNQNGGEEGFTGQAIKALTGSGTLIRETTSGADGSYTLFIPAAQAPSGSTITIQQNNGPDKISTGGSAGNTGGLYDFETDESSFTITGGTVYTGVNFADVRVNRFLTDGQQTTLPGAVALFQHVYEPNTQGNVTFTVSSVNNPSSPSWPVVLYNDLNCDGMISSGEPVLQSDTSVATSAGVDICLVLKVTVPLGLTDGARSNNTITANFQLANTNPVIESLLSRSDLVTVSTAEAGLVIVKAVDKSQALPGETLVYSIEYENLGDEPISSIEIIDETPGFTTFISSSCGTLPAGVTNCTITAPNIGSGGTVKWIFTGELQPGESGTVTYSVVIDN